MKTIIQYLSIFYILLTCSLCGETGIASIYSIRCNHGKTTASGVALSDHGNMVAHKTYPFGTKLLITNLKNNQSTVGIVYDRGPYVSGRIIDLTPSIANKIGLTRKQGLTKVRIEVVGKIKLIK
jgi:rare lipoprotein A